MAQLEILFTDSSKIGASIIRLGTWSEWSHVDFCVSIDTVIGAKRPRVHAARIADRIDHSRRAAIMSVPCEEWQWHDAVQYAYYQIGKPYDWRGILGIGLHSREWQDNSDWFCSELVAAICQQVAAPLVDAEHVWRVTPQDLWQCPYPKKWIKGQKNARGGMQR